MYRTAKLFGTAETFEWCLANDILATRCQATVGVGEQRTVLVRQEETRCDGVHTDVRSKLRGYFISQESREVGNARFGCRITTHSGHGAESRHGTEIDNRALSRLHHRAEEYLRGDDRSRKIHIQHPFELFHLEVEERAGRCNGGSRHVTSGRIQQSVHPTVGRQHVLQVLLHHRRIHHIRPQEHRLAAFPTNSTHYLFTSLFIAPHQYHLGTLKGKVFPDFPTQHTRTAGNDHHLSLNIK